MGQWVSALAALAEGLSLIPRTHMMVHNHLYTSSSQVYNSLAWLPQALHTCGTNTYIRETLIHIK